MATTKFSEQRHSSRLPLIWLLIIRSRKLNELRKFSWFVWNYLRVACVAHAERIQRPPTWTPGTDFGHIDIMIAYARILVFCSLRKRWIDLWIWIKRHKTNANSVQQWADRDEEKKLAVVVATPSSEPRQIENNIIKFRFYHIFCVLSVEN